MKRIIAEMFDWITAIDEAIEITAKNEAHSDHKGDEPQIHTCPADCKGVPNANWHSIETVGDLPEYSGKFIVTIEEIFLFNQLYALGTPQRESDRYSVVRRRLDDLGD